MATEHTVGSSRPTSWRRTARAFAGAFGSSSSGSLAKMPFAEDLLALTTARSTSETPRHVQAALIGAIAYFILPFDFIPDMLPVLGFTDDAAVLATAIRLVSTHITPEHRDAARAALNAGSTGKNKRPSCESRPPETKPIRSSTG